MKAAWDRLNADPAKPLLSRAKDELYLPGSTFKMVTASAALEAGYGPESRWPNPHQLDLPLTNGVLQNFGNELCLGGAKTVSMIDAFRESCNVPFGEIGLKLGADRMQAQAQAYGFCPIDPPTQTTCIENTIPFVVPFQTGRFPIPSYFDQNDPLLAFSAIGLDNVLANPLQLGLVGAAIANRGIEMQPRLVTEVRAPDNTVVKEFPPQEYGRPISSESANDLRRMMIEVVQNGTGYSAQIAGVHGRRQDGHRDERRGEPAERLVRLVRTGGRRRRPEDRRGGYRSRRRRPGQRGDGGSRGRPDRQAGVGGMPERRGLPSVIAATRGDG